MSFAFFLQKESFFSITFLVIHICNEIKCNITLRNSNNHFILVFLITQLIFDEE